MRRRSVRARLTAASPVSSMSEAEPVAFDDQLAGDVEQGVEPAGLDPHGRGGSGFGGALDRGRRGVAGRGVDGIGRDVGRTPTFDDGFDVGDGSEPLDERVEWRARCRSRRRASGGSMPTRKSRAVPAVMTSAAGTVKATSRRRAHLAQQHRGTGAGERGVGGERDVEDHGAAGAVPAGSGSPGAPTSVVAAGPAASPASSSPRPASSTRRSTRPTWSVQGALGGELVDELAHGVGRCQQDVDLGRRRPLAAAAVPVEQVLAGVGEPVELDDALHGRHALEVVGEAEELSHGGVDGGVGAGRTAQRRVEVDHLRGEGLGLLGGLGQEGVAHGHGCAAAWSRR